LYLAGSMPGFLVPSNNLLSVSGNTNNTSIIKCWYAADTPDGFDPVEGKPNGDYNASLLMTNPSVLINPFTGKSSQFLEITFGYGQSPGAASTYITSMPLAETTPTCDFTSSNFCVIWKQGGDFDNGLGFSPDGPYINKVDEGVGMYYVYGSTQNRVYGTPYYSTAGQPPGASLISPNRQIASPVVFGSLPIGFSNMVSASTPSTNILLNSWLTLQFSPNPNSPNLTDLALRKSVAGYNEGGSLITNPVLPDHLLLDFFQMPVVEPYPISDPFSTAGKVNMNYQIAPFSYIHRDAAMRGVLKSVMITAINEGMISAYKYAGNGDARYFNQNFGTTNHGVFTKNGSGLLGNVSMAQNSGNFYYHYPVEVTETLKQFTNRFATNDLFHSPSEICSIWLYPGNQPNTNGMNGGILANTTPLSDQYGNPITYTANNSLVRNWWYGGFNINIANRMGLTGDNLRERPYNYLYPRLTTKSNTYQIHYRVQTLKQTKMAHSADWTTWKDPGTSTGTTDKVLGDMRGSAIIERFIDPSDPKLPDFASPNNKQIMDTYYRFRVINSKQFNP
jgi:uncharacterized protein (TIGR02600 family)